MIQLSHNVKQSLLPKRMQGYSAEKIKFDNLVSDMFHPYFVDILYQHIVDYRNILEIVVSIPDTMINIYKKLYHSSLRGEEPNFDKPNQPSLNKYCIFRYNPDNILRREELAEISHKYCFAFYPGSEALIKVFSPLVINTAVNFSKEHEKMFGKKAEVVRTFALPEDMQLE